MSKNSKPASLSRKSKPASSAKKFIIIGVIAALVASTFAVLYRPGAPQSEDEMKALGLFCGSGVAMSNRYIQEFVIPTECAEPVGITVGPDGTVWFAESGARKIGRFDPATEEFKEYTLPGTQEREKVAPVASIWSLKFDEAGSLWFPDVVTNAIWKFDPASGNFERYHIPTTSQFGTSYPINFEFSDGKLWFSEIYGKNIGVLDPAEARHATANGITEIPAMVEPETLGPLALDSDGNVWFTALTYPAIGQLVKLDPDADVLTTYKMPDGVASPVGIVPDGKGSLWINDHGTSMILKFNPVTNDTVTYATSLPQRSTSIGLYEQCLARAGGSPPTCGGFPVSLPYWNTIDSRGRVWFNEHQGNSLGVFDESTMTMLEYFVPTQNPRWGACEGYSEPCGIANPLQFTIAPDGRVWFTEWSEGRIGVLNPNLPLPVSLEVVNDDRPMMVEQGAELNLDIAITAHEDLDSGVEMRLSGTMTPSGQLSNMLVSFSEPIVAFDGPSTKTVNLKLVPTDLEPGDYRITVSAKYKEVTYSKMVEITVEPAKAEL